MHDKTVTLTLPLETVRRLANAEAIGSDFTRIYEAAEAALPPEWEEGTVAWVTNRTGRCIARREGNEWATDWSNDGSSTRTATDAEVTEVEPLRVLGDDEVGIRRPDPLDFNARDVRGIAARLRSDRGLSVFPDWLEEFADALEAEEARNA